MLRDFPEADVALAAALEVFDVVFPPKAARRVSRLLCVALFETNVIFFAETTAPSSDKSILLEIAKTFLLGVVAPLMVLAACETGTAPIVSASRYIGKLKYSSWMALSLAAVASVAEAPALWQLARGNAD
jgi:hypothetical protein